MMREAVAHEAKLATLNVLLDGVEGLLLGYLHLSVRPAWYFDNHVQNTIVLVGEEGDIVPGGDDICALLSKDAVFYVVFRIL